MDLSILSSSSASTAGLILVAGVVVIAAFLWNSRRRYSGLKWTLGSRKPEDLGIPGPGPTDPKAGNFPDIVGAGSLYAYLREVHEKYGGIVQIWFGEKPVVSTASPELFRDQIKLFDKMGMEFIEPVFGLKSIQTENGQEARQRRRNYDAFLGHQYVREYLSVFRTVHIDKLAGELSNLGILDLQMTTQGVTGAEWNNLFTKAQVIDEIVEQLRRLPDGSGINVHAHMFHAACKATGVTLLGDYFLDDDNVTHFRELYDVFWPALENNFASGLPAEGTKERVHFDDVVNKVHAVARTLLAQRRGQSDRKFIDVVMETGHDEITVLGDVLVYLMGGFHSTSITLTWCLYHAAKYPETQARIHEEIVSDLTPTSTDKDRTSDLKYLRQFINETLRLRFVAPASARRAAKDTVIGGYNIPEGTHLIQAISLVMTDSNLWQDPFSFNPDRFNQSRDTKASASRPANPLAFCPFGFAGKRMCPGMKFFYDEALIYLSRLFETFEFGLGDNMDREIPINYGLLTRPEGDVILTIKRK